MVAGLVLNSALRSGKPFVCDRRNHFAKMSSQRTRKVHTVAASVVPLENCPQDARNGEGVDTEIFIGELEINTVDGKAWHSKVEVGGKFVEFKLDTGSEANIIPRQIYDNLSMRGKLEETNEVLSSYGNHRVVPVGKVSLSCTVKERTLSLDFYVVDLESVSILGLEA